MQEKNIKWEEEEQVLEEVVEVLEEVEEEDILQDLIILILQDMNLDIEKIVEKEEYLQQVIEKEVCLQDLQDHQDIMEEMVLIEAQEEAVQEEAVQDHLENMMTEKDQEQPQQTQEEAHHWKKEEIVTINNYPYN